MKAIYLDCFSGISGNMLLGVFLQAGVPEAYLRAELAKLPLEGSYVMKVEPVMKNGIAACYVDVRLPHHDGEHGHEHRTMADIRALIEASALSEAVKARSLAIFQMLAEAEGKVHARLPTRWRSTRSARSTPSSTSSARPSASTTWASSASSPQRSTRARASCTARTALCQCPRQRWPSSFSAPA